MMEYGTRIKQKRRAAELRHDAVSRQVGLSVQSLLDIEKGRLPIDSVTYRRILKGIREATAERETLKARVDIQAAA